MATTSEVKAGLDDIAATIRNCRKKFITCKASISAARAELAAIPTTFADVNTEITAYTGADDFENLCIAERTRLVTEYQGLRDEMDLLIAAF